MRATVIGGGSWGTAFARLLADRGHEVALAVRDPEQAQAIADTGRNQRYLPDVDVSDVTAVALPEIPDADVLVMAVPSHAFGEVAAGLPEGTPVLSLAKGLDPATGRRLSTLLTGHRAAVLSGPNFAAEIAAGLPGAAVIASEDEELATWLQHEINSQIFRVYVNSDLIGVELCAAAKNVIALAAGGVDGLEAGDNAKAALITRGLAEMARLAAACGARPAARPGRGDVVDPGLASKTNEEAAACGRGGEQERESDGRRRVVVVERLAVVGPGHGKASGECRRWGCSRRSW